MKTKLTQKEKDLMPIIRDKWIRKAITPTDRSIETIRNNIQELYKFANLEPTPVIVCESINEFKQRLSNWIKDNESSVRSSVWSSVESSVRSSVWSSVESSVGSSVRSSVWSSVGLYYWANDLSYYDYWKEIGIFTDSKIIKQNENLIDLLSDCSYGFITNKIAIVLTKPKVLVNNQWFLHSDETMALQWKDGSGEYFLNGVKFPEELWKKVVSKEMTLKKVMAIEDIDQRTQAMKYVEVEELLKEFNAEILSTTEKYTLDGDVVNYKLVKIPAHKDLFKIDSYHAVYNCPSTNKLYMSGIAPDIGKEGDIIKSMAWKAKMDIEDWKRLVPLSTES